MFVEITAERRVLFTVASHQLGFDIGCFYSGVLGKEEAGYRSRLAPCGHFIQCESDEPARLEWSSAMLSSQCSSPT